MITLSVNDSCDVQDKETHNVKSVQLCMTPEELMGLPSFSFKGRDRKEMRRGYG